MSDTVTQAKGLTIPTVDSDNNDWGAILNSNLGLIDTALGGTLSLSISGNTTLDGAQIVQSGYEFSGSLSDPATITWPSYFGMISITNATEGGQSITCEVSGGARSLTVLGGETRVAWSTGTSFIPIARTGGAIPITAGNGTAGGYVAKSGVGFLYEVNATCVSEAGYLMLFDATEVPADGAVEPLLCVPKAIGANGISHYDGNGDPWCFQNGIVIVFSTTGPFTKTGSTSAFLSWRIQ